jgi:hypothetical protein
MAYPKRNRPIHRYLARIYCRFRYGAMRAHFEEGWPGLRLQMPGPDGSAGFIDYKGQALAPLHPFPAPAKPDELVIVGSGPSLAGQATGKIPMASAILLNGAIHLMGEADRQPFAIVIEDEGSSGGIGPTCAVWCRNLPMSTFRPASSAAFARSLRIGWRSTGFAILTSFTGHIWLRAPI